MPALQTAAPIVGSFAVLADRFEFTPSVLLSPSNTYQVTLTTGITAAGPSGESLVAPYVFTFGRDRAPCLAPWKALPWHPVYGHSPDEGDGIINTDGDDGDALLSASGVGDDECVFLSLTGQTVSWSTTNNVGNPASPSVNVLPRPTLLERIASTANETVGNAVNVIATLVEQGIDGRAFVTVWTTRIPRYKTTGPTATRPASTPKSAPSSMWPWTHHAHVLLRASGAVRQRAVLRGERGLARGVAATD